MTISLDNGIICDCENLSELTMGSKVTEIPNNAFAYCGFETFVVPDGVTTLGYSAVSGSKLRVIYVPASVTDISSGAFGYAGVVLVGEEGSAAQNYADSYSYNGVSFITEEQSVSTGSAGANITYELV